MVATTLNTNVSILPSKGVNRPAEDNSAALMEQLQFVVDVTADDMFTRVLADGSVSYVSRAVDTLTGFAAAERTGTNVTTWVHPNDVQALTSILAPNHQNDNTFTLLRFATKWNTYVPLECRTHKVSDASGETREVILACSRTKLDSPSSVGLLGHVGAESQSITSGSGSDSSADGVFEDMVPHIDMTMNASADAGLFPTSDAGLALLTHEEPASLGASNVNMNGLPDLGPLHCDLDGLTFDSDTIAEFFISTDSEVASYLDTASSDDSFSDISAPSSPVTPNGSNVVLSLPPSGGSSVGAAKDFECGYGGCGKTFTTPANLRRHERIHQGTKPFPCAECGEGFARQADLRTHRASKCSSRKTYTCTHPGCGKTFAKAYELNMHRSTHGGAKPHVCDYAGCGKSFLRRSDLKTHYRTHTGERPYTCSFAGCGHTATTSSNLRKHERTHGVVGYLNMNSVKKDAAKPVSVPAGPAVGVGMPVQYAQAPTTISH